MKEYIVTLRQNGIDEFVRVQGFKEAVETYRTLVEIYGPKVQIFQEVVGYGETI